MNTNHLVAELDKLVSDWMRDSVSPDLVNRDRQWILGVVFGVKMARDIVFKHLGWKNRLPKQK